MQDRQLSIGSLLDYASACHPRREIVTRSCEGPITRSDYATLGRRARKLASRLQSEGVKHGDRVATLAWNTVRHLELFYAVTGIGAVLHTVNPRIFDDQIRYIISHGGARLIFVDNDFLPIVDRIFAKISNPPVVRRLDESHDIWIDEGEALECWDDVDERAAALLCYTSGTTGAAVRSTKHC